MIETSTLSLFILASLALLVTPGPAVLYIVARSIDQGRWAGLVSTLGIGVGSLFHVAAAVLGLSALLMSSALAFNIVKYAGAAYLIYLGLRKLMVKEAVENPTVGQPQKLSRIFLQGVVVNLLNPKTALFFFAFLPQFVQAGHGTIAFQIFLLGAIFVGLGICSDGSYAMLAGTIGGWLKGNLGFLRAQRYLAGGVFIALGVATALSSSSSRK